MRESVTEVSIAVRVGISVVSWVVIVWIGVQVDDPASRVGDEVG